MNDSLVQLRRDLHRQPELSGEEAGTARRIAERLASLKPDGLVTGLGGHGVAAVFEGVGAGPTVLLRCELDALPIQEDPGREHRSTREGVAHLCGHDGHMASLVGVAQRLAECRPARGRAVLLFQPAEETGAGARAVLDDPAFESLRPDLAFALHNVPGRALGEVLIRNGSFASASRGLSVELRGATAHTAYPGSGRSPARAMCRLIDEFSNLPGDLVPDGELGTATVVGSRLGTRSFGVAPGHAEVWATLRSETDSTMARLVAHAEARVADIADDDGLGHGVGWEEVFDATINDPTAADIVRRAAAPLRVTELAEPMRWSEDFGLFTAAGAGALFGLGAGETPDLHTPNYDFPDALIAVARDLFLRLLDNALGRVD